MSKPPKHTDLSTTEGDPTPRGDPIVQRFEVEARLKALAIRLKARTGERSPTGIAVAVSLLMIAGIACALVAHAIGVPGWVALLGLTLPVAVYRLILHGSRGTTR